MNSVFLTTADVGRRYGRLPQTVRGWRVKGVGPRFRRLGARVFYLLDDLLAWEASFPAYRSTAEAANGRSGGTSSASAGGTR